jgi:lysophospholipase L1-like esterase
MKVAIYGASVSEQTKNHKTGLITGYAEVLRQDHQAELDISEIRQITYAGNRLSDGGLVQLDKVVKYAPDICIFEPLIEDSRRGALPTGLDIRYVYRRLLSAGILPVTVLLPIPKKREVVYNSYNKLFSDICAEYKLPVIEVTLKGVKDLDAKFTGVHTHHAGAKIYAAQIAAGLKSLENISQIVTTATSVAEAVRMPMRIKRLGGPGGGAPQRIKGVNLTLQLEGEGPVRVRIVQAQEVGKFSPVVDLTATPADHTETVQQVKSVWDVFCHYSRQSVAVLGDLELQRGVPYTITVQISAQDPAYSDCLHDVAHWPPPEERHMRPQGLLYVITQAPFSSEIISYITA